MKFLFHTEASSKIGIGHVMRSFALCQGLVEKGHKVFLLTGTQTPTRLLQKWSSIGVKITVEDPVIGTKDKEDIALNCAKKSGVYWIIADGYEFNSIYQKKIKKAGYYLMVIDDMGHLPFYHADILLNQNIEAEKLKYNCELYTNLLLGTKYVLLRQEFLKTDVRKKTLFNVAHKILVTFGGADFDNVTMKAIEALKKLNSCKIEIKIVLGPSNPNIKSIKSSVPLNVQILENVDNIAQLMAWADIAISSGGSTCWELAYTGLPSIVLTLAENQRLLSEYLGKNGCVINLGPQESVSEKKIGVELERLIQDQEKRLKMGSKLKKLVDGLGVQRVIDYITKYENISTKMAI